MIWKLVGLCSTKGRGEYAFLLSRKINLKKNDGTFAPLVGRNLLRMIRALGAVGIEHRDLNPNSILVGQNGKVTIIDFMWALSPKSKDALASWPAVARTVNSPFRGGPKISDSFAVSTMLLDIEIFGAVPRTDPKLEKMAQVLKTENPAFSFKTSIYRRVCSSRRTYRQTGFLSRGYRRPKYQL